MTHTLEGNRLILDLLLPYCRRAFKCHFWHHHRHIFRVATKENGQNTRQTWFLLHLWHSRPVLRASFE